MVHMTTTQNRTHRSAFEIKGGDTIRCRPAGRTRRQFEVFDSYSLFPGWVCLRLIDGGEVFSIKVQEDTAIPVVEV